MMSHATPEVKPTSYAGPLVNPCSCGDLWCSLCQDDAALALGIATALLAAVAPATPAWTPVDPADPLVVRYADRSKGWGEAVDRIDRLAAARALGRWDAEDDLRRDPGLETREECLAYCVARDARLREMAEGLDDDDRDWWVKNGNDDASGLTDDEMARFELGPRTVSALDRFLDDLNDRAEDAAAGW